MHHTMFAYFDKQQDAARAIEALRAEGIGEDRLEVVVHRDHLEMEDEAELRTEETDAREGLLKGILIGGGAGAVAFGLAAGPLGLIGAPLAAAAIGAWTGGIYGGLGAVLMGRGITDQKLDKLAKRLESGGALLTVVSHDADAEQVVERVFEDYGAIEVHKPVI